MQSDKMHERGMTGLCGRREVTDYECILKFSLLAGLPG